MPAYRILKTNDAFHVQQPTEEGGYKSLVRYGYESFDSGSQLTSIMQANAFAMGLQRGIEIARASIGNVEITREEWTKG